MSPPQNRRPEKETKRRGSDEGPMRAPNCRDEVAMRGGRQKSDEGPMSPPQNRRPEKETKRRGSDEGPMRAPNRCDEGAMRGPQDQKRAQKVLPASRS